MIGFGLLCIGNISNVVVASNDSSGLDFTYSNKLPENQIGDSDYFNLKVKAGDKQTLETTVTNKTKEKMTIIVTLGNAGTTTDGTINYLSEEKIKGKMYLTDIATAPKEITLKGLEQKTIDIHLTIPKEGIKGTILGGVDLEKKEDPKKVTKESGVDNRYSYLFSIAVTENEQAPEVELTTEGILYNDEAQTIVTPIVNGSDTLAKDITIERTITPKGSSKVILSESQEQFKIAANSTLHYTQPLGELADGDYVAHTDVKLDKQQWSWDHDFSVKKDKEKTELISVQKENLSKPFSFPLIILIGSIGFLMVIIAMALQTVLKKKAAKRKKRLENNQRAIKRRIHK